jgi:hypothetical protein
MTRQSKREREVLMEKVPLVSGDVTNTQPGTKLLPARGRRKLLRKRETYDSYFERNLPRVDAALRRVQTFRATAIQLRRQESSDEEVPDTSKFRILIRGKFPLKECGRKEKEKLKKYATTLLARRKLEVTRLESSRASRLARREEKRLKGIDDAARKRLGVNPDDKLFQSLSLSSYETLRAADPGVIEFNLNRPKCRLCARPKDFRSQVVCPDCKVRF